MRFDSWFYVCSDSKVLAKGLKPIQTHQLLLISLIEHFVSSDSAKYLT